MLFNFFFLFSIYAVETASLDLKPFSGPQERQTVVAEETDQNPAYRLNIHHIKDLNFNLQQLTYDMFTKSWKKLQNDLTDSFGALSKKRIEEMMFEGSLNYLTLFWTYNARIMDIIQTLERFCAAVKPKHPLIINADLGDYSQKIKSFHDKYRGKLGHCDIKYHGDCYTVKKYPDLPFVSISCAKASELADIQTKMERVDLKSLSSDENDLRKGIEILNAKIPQIRHLSIDFEAVDSKEVESLVKLLKSPENVLEALQLGTKSMNLQHSFLSSTENINMLKSAFESENFKVKSLIIVHPPDGRLLELVRAVRGKVTKLGLPLPDLENVSEFFTLISGEESRVNELEIYCSWHDDIFPLFSFDFSDLEKALTSETNKIKILTMRSSHAIRLRVLTAILTNPNNKLEFLHLDSWIAGSGEVDGFRAALRHPNCKLKEFTDSSGLFRVSL